MQHLDDGVLHALLDGEVASPDLITIERHLEQCESCRNRMAEARAYRDEAGGMLEELDDAPVLLAMAMAPAPAPVPAGAFSAGAVEPAVRSIQTGRKARRLAPWIGVTGLAAAALLAVAVSRRSRTTAADLGEVTQPLEQAAEPAPNRDSGSAGKAAGGGVARSNQRRSEPKAKTTELDRVDAQAAPPAQRQAAGSDEPAKDAKAGAVGGLKKEAAPATPPAAAPEKVAEVVAPAVAPSSLADKDAVRSLVVRKAADSLGGRLQATRLRTAEDEVLPRTIGADAAIKALGGSIRLVDGLTPARYEQQGIVVRVIYQTPWGALALEQWRAGNVLAHKLVAPSGAPEDSVGAWRERIR